MPTVGAVAVGALASSASEAVAIGHNSVAGTTNSISIGPGATSNGKLESISIGSSATSGANYEIRFGWAGAAANPVSTTAAAGVWTWASDERLKKDIAPLDQGLDFIEKLRPVSFKWKADIDGFNPHTGFIAQEVLEAQADCDFEEFDGISSTPGVGGEFLTLGKEAFWPVAVKAIQELSAKVAMLEQKLKDYYII